jgi:hypothetical protein
MKKKKKILFKLASVTTLMALLLSTTIGCSEDKNDDDDTQNSDIAGSYTGKANVIVAGVAFLEDHPATAVVTQGDDVDKASLVINANDLPPLGDIPIGNITINATDLNVKNTNGLYSLEGDVPFELQPLLTQPMTLKLTGDVNANTLTVTLVSDDQVATVTFTGNK